MIYSQLHQMCPKRIISIRYRYSKCDGKVTFTRPFLMLGKVTSEEHVNVWERIVKVTYSTQGPFKVRTSWNETFLVNTISVAIYCNTDCL